MIGLILSLLTMAAWSIDQATDVDDSPEPLAVEHGRWWAREYDWLMNHWIVPGLNVCEYEQLDHPIKF